MSPADQRLLRHLVTAVLLKLAVLTVLWWAFVRDGVVEAGSQQTADHLVAPASRPPAPTGVSR